MMADVVVGRVLPMASLVINYKFILASKKRPERKVSVSGKAISVRKY